MRSAGPLLLAIGLGASVGLAGCGGAGEPVGGGSPLEDPPETELLVRLNYWPGPVPYPSGWDVAVYRDGRCRAHVRNADGGGPIGLFEARLGDQLLSKIRATVSDAVAARLRRRYPAHGYDSSWCSVCIWVDGKLRCTSYDPVYRQNPGPLRALYREKEWGDYESNGLVEDALNRAYERPVSAIAVEMSQLRATYHVGEPIPVAMAVRSVGTCPVAVPTLDCQEVVYGECYVALWYPPGTNPPIEAPDSDRSVRRYFGGREDRRIRDVLSPEALADLDRFVILQPGEAYVLPWSPTLSAQDPLDCQVYAGFATRERYELEAINQALSAPYWSFVCSAKSPRIDIVK